VLSGFLITKVLLNSINSSGYFRNFYIRRALRIFPIYYLFISVFFLGIFLFTPKSSHQYLRDNYPYYFVYLQNFLFVFKGLEPTNYLSHLWSLAMEEQFYFLWPVTVYLIRDTKKLKALLLAVIVVVFFTRLFVWYKFGHRFETYHCNTFTRIDTIAFGCLLGCGFSYKDLTKLARTTIIIICTGVFPLGILLFKDYFLTNPLFATVGYTAISILTIFFIEYFITAESKFRFLKTNWLINYIGQISYGMYLVHIPVYFIISGKSGFPIW
jgi:peptidoglycan/LPS O-acetylase OafA/YrhL